MGQKSKDISRKKRINLWKNNKDISGTNNKDVPGTK